MTMQEQFSKVGRALRRHAPELLTAAGVVGLGATSYLVGQASFKAGGIAMAEFVSQSEEDPKPMPAKELVKETWKFYIPAAVVFVVTAGVIIGGNRVSHNRQVALLGAAAIAEQQYREYRDKVGEHLTKPKEQKIRDEIAQDKIDDKKEELDLLSITKEGEVLCLEKYTGRVFVSSANKIYKAMNDINRVVNQHGYASHNEFMSLLGLSPVEAGDVVGWNDVNVLDVKIDGGLHNEKDPVLTVGYNKEPIVNFRDPWGPSR